MCLEVRLRAIKLDYMKLDWVLKGSERPSPEPSSGIYLTIGQRRAYPFSKGFQFKLVFSYLLVLSFRRKLINPCVPQLPTL